ncbi:sigma-70 family RNA polymerase sigma factor [Methylobacterium sp. Leaf125]|uniref:sigma-70 family RNA polymerase sigma factor n=1 Tax=Methylobacterium sp. Leaf125 TaxID=1736265 RepID=UPI001FCD7340|nr:sigma-70 family RNA polymerase sigma factor [Methylobacterium sp. Leaf125]
MTRTPVSASPRGMPPAAATLLAALVREQAALVEVAARILRDRATAEDVVQDVVLKLCEASACPEVAAPAPYLRRMVRNAAVDCARRHLRERCRLAPDADAEAVPAPCACPLAHLERCEALRAVLAALERTPDRTRRVFLAHRIDGVPQNVLAREAGISPTLVNFIIRDGTALCRAAAA